MKKTALCLVLILALALTVQAAFAQVNNTYTWEGYEITNVEFAQDIPLQPADMKEDEQSVAIGMVVPAAIVADESLNKSLYAQAALINNTGDVYHARGWLSNDETGQYYFLFPVPKTIEKETLALTFIKAEGDAPLIGDEKVTFVTQGGKAITLWPESGEAFAQLDQMTQVHVLLDAIHYKGVGFTMEAGTTAGVKIVMQTEEFLYPLVFFAFEGENMQEAGLVGVMEALAQNTFLILDGQEHNPSGLWIADGHGVFVFKQLDGMIEDIATPAFTYKDEKLTITLQP